MNEAMKRLNRMERRNRKRTLKDIGIVFLIAYVLSVLAFTLFRYLVGI
jgi:hypothetical protein